MNLRKRKFLLIFLFLTGCVNEICFVEDEFMLNRSDLISRIWIGENWNNELFEFDGISYDHRYPFWFIISDVSDNSATGFWGTDSRIDASFLRSKTQWQPFYGTFYNNSIYFSILNNGSFQQIRLTLQTNNQFLVQINGESEYYFKPLQLADKYGDEFRFYNNRMELIEGTHTIEDALFLPIYIEPFETVYLVMGRVEGARIALTFVYIIDENGHVLQEIPLPHGFGIYITKIIVEDFNGDGREGIKIFLDDPPTYPWAIIHQRESGGF